MKKNFRLAGLAAVTACALVGPAVAANAAPDPGMASPDIVGGQEVSINSAPFHVLLV